MSALAVPPCSSPCCTRAAGVGRGLRAAPGRAASPSTCSGLCGSRRGGSAASPARWVSRLGCHCHCQSSWWCSGWETGAVTLRTRASQWMCWCPQMSRHSGSARWSPPAGYSRSCQGVRRGILEKLFDLWCCLICCCSTKAAWAHWSSTMVFPSSDDSFWLLSGSLVWEDDWRTDIFMASLKEMDKGNPVRLVLTVSGQLLRGVSSSTPARSFLVPETTQSPVLPADDRPLGQDLEDPTGVKSQSSEVPARASRPVKNIQPPLRTVVVPCALKSPAGKVEPSEAWRKSPNQEPPRVHSKKPRKVLFEPTASEKDLDEEDLAVKELQGSPSPRWCHAMCLSDRGTAVLIGGEGVNQQSCRDAFWKLETDSDLWLPVGFQLQNAMPSCLHGHTATYDPDTKRIYIFGGIREDKDYSSMYILDTVTWKWLLVAAKGRIPVLTYHSATIYHKELFVFGGTFPRKASLAVAPCSNVLYVFNPEHEIWYQPISEGEKPLPRLGHSATLLKNKLLIFGGRRTSLYLSDMHILDLGFMEYTPVPLLAGQPSARCFHAALAVSDQKVLISGGCNARGAFHDAFVFHLDTLSWSTVIHHDLCSVPRAGHTLLDMTPAHLMDMDKEKKEEQNLHKVLVFGGSNCAGTFYNSTVKIQLDLG